MDLFALCLQPAQVAPVAPLTIEAVQGALHALAGIGVLPLRIDSPHIAVLASTDPSLSTVILAREVRRLLSEGAAGMEVHVVCIPYDQFLAVATDQTRDGVMWRSMAQGILQRAPLLARSLLDRALERDEDDPATHYEHARASMVLGDHQGAIVSLARSLQLRDDPVVHAALAQEYLEAGQIGPAIASLEAAVGGTEVEPGWLVLLGGLYSQRGDLGQADEVIERAITLDPANADALLAQGRMLILRGHLQEASALLEKLQDGPLRGQVLALQAHLLAAMGQDDRATDLWRSAALTTEAPTGTFLDWAVHLQQRHSPAEALEVIDRGLRRPSPPPSDGFRTQPQTERKMRTMLKVMRVQSLMSLSRLEEALAESQQLVEQEPDVAIAWRLQGETLHLLGRTTEATASLAQAVLIDPHLAAAWSSQGLVHAALGHTAAAIMSYERATTLDPTDADAWNEWGTLLYEQEHHAEAAERFAAAAEHRRDWPMPWINLGNTLHILGRSEEAVEALRFALEADPEAIPALRSLEVVLLELNRLPESVDCSNRLVALLPRDLDVRKARAHLRELCGDPSGAIEDLEEGRRAQIPDAERGVFLREIGRLHHRLGHRTEAERALREAIVLGESPEARTDLGVVLLASGDLTEAIGQLERAVALAPDAIRSLRALANALYQQGDAARALPLFERLVRLDPGASTGWADLGNTLSRLERNGESLEAYHRAAALDPGATGPLRLLAQALLRAKDYPGAREALDQVRAREGETCELLNLEGQLVTDQGDMMAAASCFERSLAQRHDQPAVWNNLGFARFRLGQTAAAIEALRTAVGLEESLADAWFNLGNALESTGDHDAAADSFSRAALHPEHRLRSLVRGGLSLLAAGRTAEGTTLLQQALVEDPGDRLALDHLAQLHLQAEDFTSALGYLERLSKHAPADDLVLVATANAFLGLGRRAEALDALRRALALNPSNEAARDLVGVLGPLMEGPTGSLPQGSRPPV